MAPVPKSPAGPRFEIWEVGQRIHSVDNPVRLRILHVLGERPRRLPEIVRLTGKAKSTLSELHVRPLVELGLISEQADPEDARSKIYRLEGQRLGSSDVDVARLRASVLAYARRAGGSATGELLRILDLPSLVQSGARPAYLDAFARRLGQALGEPLQGKKREEALAWLAQELRTAGLGTLRVDGGTLHVEGLPKPLAQLVAAMAKAALDRAQA